MNNDDVRRFNVLIENELYNAVFSLKEENEPQFKIVIAIENFRERYANMICKLNLERNYIENYLNNMYKKINGKSLFYERQEVEGER